MGGCPSRSKQDMGVTVKKPSSGLCAPPTPLPRVMTDRFLSRFLFSLSGLRQCSRHVPGIYTRSPQPGPGPPVARLQRWVTGQDSMSCSKPRLPVSRLSVCLLPSNRVGMHSDPPPVCVALSRRVGMRSDPPPHLHPVCVALSRRVGMHTVTPPPPPPISTPCVWPLQMCSGLPLGSPPTA
jgi:hypothetical protein